MARTRTIVDILRYRAAERGERPLYTWLDENANEVESWSFADLSLRAHSIALQLQEGGLRHERALLLYPPGLPFTAAFFGCLCAGVVAVPANLPRRNRTDNRLRAILEDVRPRIILSTSGFVSRREEYLSLNPALRGLHWLATDQPSPRSTREWNLPLPRGEDIAFLQYTSGSTADPKGVIVTHDNIVADQVVIEDILETNSERVCLIWLPLFHDMGLAFVIGTLYEGCRSIHMDPLTFLRKPMRWLEAMSRYKCTHTSAPNFAYDLCVRSTRPEQRRKLDLSCLHSAVNSSEPVRGETMERFVAAFGPCGFRRDMFTPAYGLAEATAFVTGATTPDRPVLRSVSSSKLLIGKAAPVAPETGQTRTFAACGTTGREKGILVVDPETLLECEPEQIGEIWLAGSHISPGYWNKAEESHKTFQARLADTGEGPFLRTGDLGFVLEGQLYVTGRIKDLIIIRGGNYFPQDIEFTVENSHPSLQKAAGAAFGIERGSEELLIVAQEVKRAARRDLDVGEIASKVRRAVTAEHGVAVDGLLLVKPLRIPKTSSGKIRRPAVRQAFLDGTLEILDQWLSSRMVSGGEREGAEWDYPRPFEFSSDHHNNITQIRSWISWQIGRLTDIPGSDLNLSQPLTDYGLDSLVSVRVAHQLAEWVNQPLELAKLWELPSVEALVEYLVEMLEQGAVERSGDVGTVPLDRLTKQDARRMLDRVDDLDEAELDELLAILESGEPPSSA